jgi:PKD repeat protein
MNFHPIILFLLMGLLISPLSAETMQFADVYDGRISIGGVDFTPTQIFTYSVGNDLTTSANISTSLIASSTTTNNMAANRRFFMTFDTSGTPEDAIITGVSLYVWAGQAQTDGLGNNMGMCLVNTTPVNPLSYSYTTDYNNLEKTIAAPCIAHDDWGTNKNNTFTFNAYGIAGFNRTGNTTLALINSYDQAESYTGGAWVSGASNTIWVVPKAGLSGYRPFLVITYNTGLPPLSNFSVSTVHGKAPLSVSFTDTSENIPTTWNWSKKNATSGWEIFNQSQNPVNSFPAGIYDINLTVTNAHGTSTNTSASAFNSDASYPTADFTGTPVTGLAPLTVVFTDASDVFNPTVRQWNFGDGNLTNYTQTNPVHRYSTAGTYTVSETVGNATGNDTKTRTAYIFASIRHPITFDVLHSPGYLNRTIEPWLTAEQGSGGIYPSAVTGLTSPNPYYAKMMALRYQIEGNTIYANGTVDALLNSNYESGTFDCTDFGDYGIAYDQIYQTRNVNSTLDTANDTLIRDRLAYITDYCYQYMIDNPVGEGINDVYQVQGKGYPNIAIVGEVLMDYSNESQATTPAQWANLGGDGLWVNDPLHTYTYTNQGEMAEAFNPTSGFNRAASYANYFLTYSVNGNQLYNWYHIWSNIHGENYFEHYPTAKNSATYTVWQMLPQSVIPSYNSDGNIIRTNARLLYGLLDETNRSALKRAIDLEYLASANISLKPENNGPSDPAEIYLDYDNYTQMTTSEPPYTSVFMVDGEYNVFRKDWSTQTDWLSFNVWKDVSSQTRVTTHQDQLSFEYASHGDILMPDMGEIKYVTNSTLGVTTDYGLRAANHNALLFGNGTINWTRTGAGTSNGPGHNVTYRGIAKNGLANCGVGPRYPSRATTNTLIKTPFMEYIDGAISQLHLLENSPSCSSSYPTEIPNNISYSRAVMYPQKDYMIVIDRATSTDAYEHINTFRFGSFKMSPNTSLVKTIDLTYTGLGSVNGTLNISSTPWNWKGETFRIENSTGITGNDIVWQTTSPYGDNTYLQLFTAPASPITFEKWYSRIGVYSETDFLGGKDAAYVPQVYFKQDANTSFYRVTALLSAYENETKRAATELPVTGYGSAIKVLPAAGATKDYVYTGIGNNTFDTVNTDADTLFYRKAINATGYTLVNGTHLYDGTRQIFNSTRRLNSIAVNRSDAGVNSVNVSGTGSTVMKFFNLTGTPTYVRIDDVGTASWSMDGSTLSITTTLSDHNIQFDEAGGEGPTPTPTTPTPTPTLTISPGPTIVEHYCPAGAWCFGPFIWYLTEGVLN